MLPERGSELGFQAEREEDSRNVSASRGRPRGPSAPGQEPRTQGPSDHRAPGQADLDARYKGQFYPPLVFGFGQPVQPL